MVDINNTNEYRASVLSALGIEDDVNIRYFADYRKALLTGLGIEFCEDDLRNEEKFRLKTLEAVSNIDEVIHDLLDGNVYTEKTASGSPASFDDGAYNLPVKSLIVTVGIKQEGSGDPSPHNIRPFIPWTNLKIYKSGENTNQFTVKDVHLGQDIYIGEIDIARGKIVAPYKAVNMGTLSYTHTAMSNGRHMFATPQIADLKPSSSNSENLKAYATMYKASNYLASWKDGDMTYASATPSNAVAFLNNAYSDAAAFKTAMNGQMFIYPLVTPIEYDFPSEEIKTYLGVNRIWSDGGNVTVKYLAK